MAFSDFRENFWWITLHVLLLPIHLIAIYPLDSVIRPYYNWALVLKSLKAFLLYVMIGNRSSETVQTSLSVLNFRFSSLNFLPLSQGQVSSKSSGNMQGNLLKWLLVCSSEQLKPLMFLIPVALSDPCKDCSLCQKACYVI